MDPTTRLMKLTALFMLVCLAVTTNAFIFAIGRLLAGLGGFLFRGIGAIGRGALGLLGGLGRLLFGKVVPACEPTTTVGDFSGGFTAPQGGSAAAFPAAALAAPK